ncbi:hypothetical protein [Leptospira weilii]|uniref:hypothetical protein n=1 Tax=Leptospira weilii TaxID=28184 RepID=UPI001EF20273|nr:hypothetical protein [Leptospira weilii]ULH27550.1 hypothetical protein FH586_14180 [Leptospira weilii]
MNSNRNLSQEITETILTAIENETIDRKTLRQIIVGVSRLGDAILLWALNEWNDYPYADESKAFAKLSNADWLDQWDTLTDPTGEEANTLRPRLRSEIHAAIRRIIMEQSLGDFERLVGFAEYRLNPHADIEHGTLANIDGDTEGEVFAFYHPDCTTRIMGFMERLSRSLIYPYGVLTEKGITFFYPEGKQDALSGKDKTPGVRILEFKDIEAWWLDDRLIYRSKNQPINIGLCHGHTHDKWGQPSRKEIDEKLREHFETYIPELFFSIESELPDRNDSAASTLWWEKLTNYEIHSWRLSGRILAEYGSAARQFVENFAPSEKRIGALKDLVRVMSDRKEFGQAAFEILESFETKERIEVWSTEVLALFGLERYESVLELLAVVREELEKPRKGHRLADEKELLEWECLALAVLGRGEEALSKIEENKLDDVKTEFARAIILQENDLSAAHSALFQSLQSGSSHNGEFWIRLGLGRFIVNPDLAKWIERSQKLRENSFNFNDPIRNQIQTTPIRSKIFVSSSKKWQTIRTLPIESNVESALLHQNQIWIAGSKELSYLRLEDPQNDSLAIVSEGNFTGLATVGNYLYTTDNEGLSVFDLSKVETRLGWIPKLDGEKENRIAASERWIATAGDHGCTIYSCTNPASPKPVSKIRLDRNQYGSGNGIAFKKRYLFYSTDRSGLFVFDLQNPEKPECINSLQLNEIKRGDGDLWLFDDLVVMKVSDGVWLLDVSKPDQPNTLARLTVKHFKTPVRIETSLYLITERNEMIEFDLSSLEFRQSTYLVGPDGKLPEEPQQAMIANDQLFVLSSTGFAFLEQTDVPSYPDPQSKIAPLKEPIREKILSWLSTIPKEFKVGAVVLERYGTFFRLNLDQPRSFVGIAGGPVDWNYTQRLEWELSDWVDAKQLSWLDDFNESSDLDLGDPISTFQYRSRLREEWSDFCEKILRWISTSEEFLCLAAGKVYLLVSGNRRLKLIDTFRDPTKEWKPFRSEIKTSGRTLDEMLSDFDLRSRMTERAKNEIEVRERAFALASEGNLCALRIVENIQELDTEAAIETFKKAATHKLTQYFDTGAEAVEELAKYKSIPHVHEFLTDLTQSARPALQIEALLALGEADSDPAVHIVRRLLQFDESLQSTKLLDDFEYSDLAIKTLQNMKRRLPELQADLLSWIKQNPKDNRMSGIAAALFYSGYSTLPTEVAVQALPEKSGEEYHQMYTGIHFLDEADWDQYEICAVERLFTGKRLAVHALELKEKSDETASLWPSELPHEPWNASWSYVLASAWKHLENANAKEWFETALAKRALISDKAYNADRKLLSCVLIREGTAENIDAVLRLAPYFLDTPENVFTETEKDYAKRMLVWASVQRGFALAKEKEFTAAREMTDSVLALDPTEGQALFLEARLAWLENGSAEKGIEQAKLNLEKVDRKDSLGNGRLLNLVGCALDELKRWDEAVEWFDRAAKAHPEDPMYLSNLAEAHSKRGAKEQAIQVAELAKRSGGKAEILEEILKEKE